MNILIATHDMIAQKAHLMPWRIIHEVARAHSDPDAQIFVASLIDRALESSAPPGVRQIDKSKTSLQKQLEAMVKEHNIDVVYWPVTWREPAWRIKVAASVSRARVAYLPSGVFGPAACIYAALHLGLRKSLPYLLDSVLPPRRLIHRLWSAGFSDLITLSEFTAATAEKAGRLPMRVHAILPGRDYAGETIQTADSESITGPPQDARFMLFVGPPSRIRGVFEMLRAFNKAADADPSLQLVCLFRADAELDSQAISKDIEQSPYRDRIHVQWESVTRRELRAFMGKALAVIMPFILVPSEIPLAIIEAAGFGTPVITTSSGGTGAFAERFGIVTKVGDIDGLANAMIRISRDDKLRAILSQRALATHAGLADWSNMSHQWLNVGRLALAGPAKR